MAANEIKILQAETSKIATGSTPSQDCLNFKEVAVELNVTNISGTTPTLDVKIQHSHDNINWSDLFSFTQVTTVQGIQTKYVPNDTQFGFMRYLRAYYTITGTDPDYTFSVTIVAKE